MELTNYKVIMIFKYLRAAQGGEAKPWLSKAGVQYVHVIGSQSIIILWYVSA